jgi:type I restriction enzyme, R subunit
MKLNNLTEEALEQEAIERIGAFGYETINAYQETFGEGSLLGRETSSEVVLKDRLRKKLVELNPDLPSEAIDNAIYILIEDSSILNPFAANKQLYKNIKDGVKIQYKDQNGINVEEVVNVINWNEPKLNNFLAVRQFKVSGEMYNCRADFVVFINGLPLILAELKASHKNLQNALNDNIRHYKTSIPQLLWYNAFIIISNGTEAKIGSITSLFEHFSDWKRINSEGEKGIISLDTLIKGVLDKERLLDLIENFILYQDDRVKIIAKNHQYLGVNKAIESLVNRDKNNGKLGVFWHTQGSGKSFSMIFFTQKILRKTQGNWTFLIVTDRDDLDKQIYKNFASTGAVTEPDVQAKDRKHLKKLLSEDHRNIFTTIQKFGTGEKGKILDELSPRSNIIVITDEAHRSQYETLAMSMRKALPKAAYIAFTGTPLIKGEEKTKNIFGDYVSIYNFKQSVDDKATKPLYYENRMPELQIINEKLEDDINKIIKEADLTEEEEEKFAKKYVNTYQLITRDDRLEKIATDVVDHFMNRGYMGKAMYIAIDKATAVKMYDKVQNQWLLYKNKLETELNTCKPEYKDVIKNKINYMNESDMAVIVSPSQNEIEDIKKKGADITLHRIRMNKDSKIDEKFKDPENHLRIVFVCAMWITGFDAPNVSTLYLDKILKDHTLMQTMARANRVWQDKPNGLIVDYIGIFRHLQRALAIYGDTGIEEGEFGTDPIKDKNVLVNMLKEAFNKINDYCQINHIDLFQIFNEKNNFNKIKLLDEAVENILATDKTTEAFFENYSKFNRLYKAVMPDIEAEQYLKQALILAIINQKLNITLKQPVDTAIIKELAEKVETLLDESISIDDYQIIRSKQFDLTKVNFEELKERFFNKDKQKTIIEKLKANINSRIQAMMAINKSRIAYLEKFQRLIEEYNSGEIDLEQLFLELVHLSRSLDKEEQRHMQENLTEEELVIFDILTKPEPKLSKKEIDEVKETARELLGKLKRERLVIAWRKKQSTRAKVLHEIEDICDKKLPDVYEAELFKEKCNILYMHFYDNYPTGKHAYYEQNVA